MAETTQAGPGSENLSLEAQKIQAVMKTAEAIRNPIYASPTPADKRPAGTIWPEVKMENGKPKTLTLPEIRKVHVVNPGTPQEKPLVDYLDGKLGIFLPTLSPAEKKALTDSGVVTIVNGNETISDDPEKRMQFVAAIIHQVEEKGLNDIDHALQGDGVRANDALSCLQALGLDYADKVLPTPQGTETTTRTVHKKREITRKSKGRVQISSRFSTTRTELELSQARASLFAVNRTGELINVNGEKKTYSDVELQLAKAVQGGTFSDIPKIVNQFDNQLSKADVRGNIVRLAQRLTTDEDSHLTADQKNQLKTLLPILEDKTTPATEAQLKKALAIALPIESWVKDLNGTDQVARKAAGKKLYGALYDWGQVMFGNEGLQRTVEVDLRMAVGLQDVLLPPAERLARIRLEQKIAESRGKSVAQENSLAGVVTKLVTYDEEYTKSVAELEALRQTERKAILLAMGVKYEDGTSVVDPGEVDAATKDLQTKITANLDKTMRTSIMDTNRQETVAMLASAGVTLTEDQQKQVNAYLESGAILNATDAIQQKGYKGEQGVDALLSTLGIEKTNPNYAITRRIIADGRRVANAVATLGNKKNNDSWSQTETIKIGGTTLDMGLKGLEYIYRQKITSVTKDEETSKTEKKPGEKGKVPGDVPEYGVDEAPDLADLGGLLDPVPPKQPEPVLVDTPPNDEYMDTKDGYSGPASAPHGRTSGEATSTVVIKAVPESQDFPAEYFEERDANPNTGDKVDNKATTVVPSADYTENAVGVVSASAEQTAALEAEKNKRTEQITKRIQSQKDYVEGLRERYKITSTDPAQLRMLQRLNGCTKDYVAELEEVVAGLPPMNEKCKMTVVIPAYNEEGKIEKSLRSWIDQQDKDGKPFDPDEVEFIVLVNRPNEAHSFDNTAGVIDGLSKTDEFKGMHINVVNKTFNFPDSEQKIVQNGVALTVPKGVRMGMIYKYGADLVALRNLARADKERVADHLMRTGGADVYSRNPGFFSEVTSIFEDNHDLEQYTSRSDYPPAIYRKIPLLHVASRLNDMMNLRLTRGKSHIGNGTYRTSLYAEAGGFDAGIDIREEMDLSKRMRKVMMTHEGRPRVRSTKINAIDDPRRAVAATLAGIPITRIYSDFKNQSIREINLQDVLNKPITPEAELTIPNVQKQISAVFRSYLNQYYDPKGSPEESLSEAFARTKKDIAVCLKVLGIDNVTITYDGDLISDNTSTIDKVADKIKINIPNIDKLQGLIEEYKQGKKADWMEGDLKLPPDEAQSATVVDNNKLVIEPQSGPTAASTPEPEREINVQQLSEADITPPKDLSDEQIRMNAILASLNSKISGAEKKGPKPITRAEADAAVKAAERESVLPNLAENQATESRIAGAHIDAVEEIAEQQTNQAAAVPAVVTPAEDVVAAEAEFIAPPPPEKSKAAKLAQRIKGGVVGGVRALGRALRGNKSQGNDIPLPSFPHEKNQPQNQDGVLPEQPAAGPTPVAEAEDAGAIPPRREQEQKRLLEEQPIRTKAKALLDREHSDGGTLANHALDSVMAFTDKLLSEWKLLPLDNPERESALTKLAEDYTAMTKTFLLNSDIDMIVGRSIDAVFNRTLHHSDTGSDHDIRSKRSGTLRNLDQTVYGLGDAESVSYLKNLLNKRTDITSADELRNDYLGRLLISAIRIAKNKDDTDGIVLHTLASYAAVLHITETPELCNQLFPLAEKQPPQKAVVESAPAAVVQNPGEVAAEVIITNTNAVNVKKGEELTLHGESKKVGVNAGDIVAEGNSFVAVGANEGNIVLKSPDSSAAVRINDRNIVALSQLATVGFNNGYVNISSSSTVFVDNNTANGIVNLTDDTSRAITISHDTNGNFTVGNITSRGNAEEKRKTFLKTVYLLPKEVGSVQSLITNEQIDRDKVKTLGGIVIGEGENVRVVFKAINGNDNEVEVSFKLQQVPNENGKDNPMLVMVKVEEVKSEAQAEAAQPTSSSAERESVLPNLAENQATESQIEGAHFDAVEEIAEQQANQAAAVPAVVTPADEVGAAEAEFIAPPPPEKSKAAKLAQRIKGGVVGGARALGRALRGNKSQGNDIPLPRFPHEENQPQNQDGVLPEQSTEAPAPVAQAEAAVVVPPKPEWMIQAERNLQAEQPIRTQAKAFLTQEYPVDVTLENHARMEITKVIAKLRQDITAISTGSDPEAARLAIMAPYIGVAPNLKTIESLEQLVVLAESGKLNTLLNRSTDSAATGSDGGFQSVHGGPRTSREVAYGAETDASLQYVQEIIAQQKYTSPTELTAFYLARLLNESKEIIDGGLNHNIVLHKLASYAAVLKISETPELCDKLFPQVQKPVESPVVVESAPLPREIIPSVEAADNVTIAGIDSRNIDTNAGLINVTDQASVTMIRNRNTVTATGQGSFAVANNLSTAELNGSGVVGVVRDNNGTINSKSGCSTVEINFKRINVYAESAVFIDNNAQSGTVTLVDEAARVVLFPQNNNGRIRLIGADQADVHQAEVVKKAVYALPKNWGIAGLHNLLTNGQIDDSKAAAKGARVVGEGANKKVIVRAENKNHDEVDVTFEVRQVPGTRGEKAEAMLVMTNVADVEKPVNPSPATNTENNNAIEATITLNGTQKETVGRNDGLVIAHDQSSVVVKENIDRLTVTNEASGTVIENSGGRIGFFDKSTGIVVVNVGTMSVEDTARATIAKNFRSVNLFNSTVGYVDSQGRDGKIHIFHNTARVVTPNNVNVEIGINYPDINNKIKNQVHYKLPEGIDSLSSLLIDGNTIDVTKVQAVGGTVAEQDGKKTITIKTRNGNGSEVDATFELQQVENAAPMFVLVKFEDPTQSSTKQEKIFSSFPEVGEPAQDTHVENVDDVGIQDTEVGKDIELTGTESQMIKVNNSKLNIRDQSSAALAVNDDTVSLHDNSSVAVRTNADSCGISSNDISTLTVQRNEQTANVSLSDFAKAYVDSLMGPIYVWGEDTQLITPQKTAGSIIVYDEYHKKIIKKIHYKLPKGVATLSALVVDGRLDEVKVQKQGGVVHTTPEGRKLVVFPAKNGEGKVINATFELQQVPDDGGKLAQMLVLKATEKQHTQQNVDKVLNSLKKQMKKPEGAQPSRVTRLLQRLSQRGNNSAQVIPVVAEQAESTTEDLPPPLAAGEQEQQAANAVQTPDVPQHETLGYRLQKTAEAIMQKADQIREWEQGMVDKAHSVVDSIPSIVPIAKPMLNMWLSQVDASLAFTDRSKPMNERLIGFASGTLNMLVNQAHTAVDIFMLLGTAGVGNVAEAAIAAKKIDTILTTLQGLRGDKLSDKLITILPVGISSIADKLPDGHTKEAFKLGAEASAKIVHDKLGRKIVHTVLEQNPSWKSLVASVEAVLTGGDTAKKELTAEVQMRIAPPTPKETPQTEEGDDGAPMNGPAMGGEKLL